MKSLSPDALMCYGAFTTISLRKQENKFLQNENQWGADDVIKYDGSIAWKV